MSNPEDLIDKTNALLGRYRSPAPTTTSDFPTLTEVVTSPAPPSSSALAAPPPPAEDASRIKLDREALLKEILNRVTTDLNLALDARIHTLVTSHLDNAIQQASQAVQQELQRLVEECVGRALDQALSSSEVPPAQAPSHTIE